MPTRETTVESTETTVTTDASADEAIESAETKTKRARPAPRTSSSAGGAVYGLGMIGALAYFLGTAETGRDRVLAVGKAVVWPALLVYLAFKRLGA
jgi:hypothetical protein